MLFEPLHKIIPTWKWSQKINFPKRKIQLDLENQFELCDIQFVKLLNVKIGWNQMTN